MGFSISRFDTKTKANAGIEVELLDEATGAKSGAFVTVLGTDSDVFRNAAAEQGRARQERARLSPGKAFTPREQDLEAAELLAACTTGWRGLEDEGVEIPFTKERAQKYYADLPTLREQVSQAVGSRTLFLKA